MPKASEHRSSEIFKHLYIGDSATGKTTSLVALVRAGFKLRIYDYDNLLDPLIAKVRQDCPERLDSLEFMSFRDKTKATDAGIILDGMPKAYAAGQKALDKWEDGTRPHDWGPDYIIVIDSLTSMSRAAFNWARGMMGTSSIATGIPTKGVDARQVFFTAQQALMEMITNLTSADCKTNVIVIAHIKYMEVDGKTKGFPVAVGNAISPEIPSWFPSITLATKSGEKRVLRTRSTQLIDLKNPRSFDPGFADEYPMETGLATLFGRPLK